MNLSLTKYSRKVSITIVSLGGGVAQFTKENTCEKNDEKRSDKFEFCCDQEGFKWRGVDWMHAMHFDAFAIHILLNCHIFFNLEL